MYSNVTDFLFPPKRNRSDEDEVLREEDLVKVCPVKWEEHKVDLINQELDSLDDADVFSQVQSCVHSKGGPASSLSENCSKPLMPPFSTVYPRSGCLSPRYCVYLPSKVDPCVPSDDKQIPVAERPIQPLSQRNTINPVIAQDARLETTVLEQIAQLRQQGVWSAGRLPKVMEPVPEYTWNDCFLEEVTWMAVDFCEERKWKMNMARNLAEAARNYLILRLEWNRQCQLAEELCRKRNAAYVATIVRDWWRHVNEGLEFLRESANRQHSAQLSKLNKLALTTCSDLGPSWVARVPYEVSPFFEWPQSSSSDFKALRSDGDSHDSDWLPSPHNSESDSDEPHSRSTSSSRAASFVDDSDVSVFGISEFQPTYFLKQQYEEATVRERRSDNRTLRTTDPMTSTLKQEGVHQQEQIAQDNPVVKSQEDGFNVSPVVERTELEALISEAALPLHQLLPARNQLPRLENDMDRSAASPGIQLSCKPMSPESFFADAESDDENSEVVLLKTDAEKSLDGILPPGYLDSDKHIIPGEHNGASHHSMMDTHNDHPSDLADSQNGGISEPDSVYDLLEDEDYRETKPPDENIPFRQDNSMGLVDSPWNDVQTPLTRITNPNELRWAALQLSPLLKPNVNSCTSSSALLATAYSPAFRVRFLPSTSVGSIVTWLRHAVSRGVPGLLLSQSAISGDAELAVAAHLGQLIVPVAHSFDSFWPECLPKQISLNETGDWGPHLIVAPRLCIPVWRTRLSNWCPGLRITCLGVGACGTTSRSEPSGTGRRLRSSVVRGAVNVCITSYAAILARPSRYSRIRWHVVVLDQVHHLFSCKNSAVSSQSMKPTLNQTSHQSGRISSVASSALDILISELRYSGHRLLISSATDLLSSACGFRLFELSRLLMSQCATDCEEHKLWTAELFSAVEGVAHNPDNQPIKRERPSKKQLIKFLEPFVLRLEEEYESGDEKVVHCPMTAAQRKVHDAIMSSKVARNASRAGGLLDLLHTVTQASRICNHPCLLATHPYSSSAFIQTLASLYTHREPRPGPFVFDARLDTDRRTRSAGLLYSTPSAVLKAVQQLRDFELSEITLQGFQLASLLKDPTDIRERVAFLAPTKQQLEITLFPKNTKENTQPKPIPPSPVPVPSDLFNGGIHYSPVRSRSHFVMNGQVSSVKMGLKVNTPLTNGLPELPTVHLDFTSIPVRFKRPRISEKFPAESPVKRCRFDDVPLTPLADLPSRPSIDSKRTATLDFNLRPIVCKTPFLGPEALNILNREVTEPKAPTGARKTHKEGDLPSTDRRSSNPSVFHRRTCDSTQTTQNSASQPPADDRQVGFNPSIRVDGLLRDNTRRCTQLTGFADWCSAATFSSLRLNRASFNQSSSTQSSGPFGFTALTNLVESLEPMLLYISQISRLGLLCSRPRVIALPPRIFTVKSGCVSSLGCQACTETPKSSSLFSTQSLYPFSEPARWLSPDIPSQFPLNHSHTITDAFNSSESTPLGRLFSESGKFFSLHCLLGEFLGAKSKPRPRCVYLLAHRSAFLNLLEAYLAISPWRMCSRVRLPSGFEAVDTQSDLLIDHINTWPRGTRGPLLVLMHSRSPTTCLTGLKAGPDTLVIICDVDLRADSVDNVRALIHSWTLNGLVDHAHQEDKTDGLSSSVQIYKLVSVGLPNRSGLCPSVEACLSREFACRLLPEAVFQAHSSAPSDCHSLLVARVQPNVVSAFLSNRVPYEPDPIVFGASYKGLESEHGSLLSIKQEAPPYSSASSVTSSSSYPFFDYQRDKSRELGEEFQNTFQEREPLCEHLLNRALELFEDPVDTQVWCCASAEQTSISRTIFDKPTQNEQLDPLGDEDDRLWEPYLHPRDVFLLEPSFATECQHLPADFSGELGYSDKTCWEVAHHEAFEYLSQLEFLIGRSNEAFFCYHAPALDVPGASDHVDELWTKDTEVSGTDDWPLPLTEASLWEPFARFQAAESSKLKADVSAAPTTVFHLGDEEPSVFVTTSTALEDRSPVLPLTRSQPVDDSEWGYETDAMFEHELPPVTQVVITSTAPTPTPAISNPQGLKRSAPPDCDIDIGKSLRYSNSFSTNSSYTRSYLKRRRLTGAGAYRKHLSILSQPLAPTSDNHFEQSLCAATDSDSSLLPPPSPSSKTSVREAVPVTRPSYMQPTASPQHVPAGTSVHGGTGGFGSSGGVTLFLNHSGSGGSNYPKLHIPRANYNKDFANSRSGRHRRSAAVSTTGTASAGGAAAVAALAAGSHLSQPSASKSAVYHIQVSSSGNLSPFSNPAILARYGHTSPGRCGPSITNSQASLPPALRYGPNGATTTVAGGLSNSAGSLSNVAGSQATGHLHVGKPLEWHVNEEAALYQSIVKLQELPFDSNCGVPPNSALSPNFRLAEFFINNFFPTRGYRGARQCLLMHTRMLTIINTAIATLSSNVGSHIPVGNSGLPEDSTISTPVSTAANIAHSQSSRKVKNKLKSSAAVAAAAANLGLSPQPSGLGSPANDQNCDSMTAVNRYRTYMSYQHLRLTPLEGDPHTASPASDVSGSQIPPQLTQLISTMKTDDESQSKILRKAIKDSFAPPPAVTPAQPHRPSSSRRQQAPGAGSPGPGYHSGGAALTGSPGPSGNIYTYPGTTSHPASSTAFPTTTGHGSYPITGPSPALLTHHRHHHHRQSSCDHTTSSQASTSATDGSVPSQPTSFSSASSCHTGPMIQKNPTHIAALQEHNINPDTLITPAMVIKNKEEREARLLAESISSNSQTPHLSPSTAGLPVTTAVLSLPSSLQPATSLASHQTPLSFYSHSQDATAHPSVLLSLPLETTAAGSGTGVTSSLSLNLTGSPLSFSHPSQRGTSFVTIVSSNPTMLRRSATFTSVTVSNQFTDTISTRVSPFQSNPGQSTVVGLSSAPLSTQMGKASVQSGYFLQRPQFLSSNTISPSSARGIFTTLSGVSGTQGLPGGGSFGSGLAPVPQILRPRNTLRGSVIQPTFVRALTATSTSSFPISHMGTRMASSSSGFLHGRVTLSVPSCPLPSVLTSRPNQSVRHQSPTIFQQVRPGAQSQLGSFSYGYQFSGGEPRSFTSQLQGSTQPISTSISGSNAVTTTSSSVSIFESASSRQSEADPFVQSRFRPQPTP
ncbi:hypothetical protein CRM22_002092 [Opisthorchis felineus]|uniref:HSA domain-containing protein n=1 Tax=Opisthorchis felineus TaxID=147828 RepID=A0A4S2M7U2_OPIFE|nr:hypothetical protein CRM22_002092 [Opisthorchis felineus]